MYVPGEALGKMNHTPLPGLQTAISVLPSPGSLNRIAIPRGPASGELSGMEGSGAPSEKRTVMGTGAWK